MSPRRGRRNNIIYLRLSLPASSTLFEPVVSSFRGWRRGKARRKGARRVAARRVGAFPFSNYHRHRHPNSHPPSPPASSADSKPWELRQYLRFCLQRRYPPKRQRISSLGKRALRPSILTFHVPEIVARPFHPAVLRQATDSIEKINRENRSLQYDEYIFRTVDFYIFSRSTTLKVPNRRMINTEKQIGLFPTCLTTAEIKWILRGTKVPGTLAPRRIDARYP